MYDIIKKNRHDICPCPHSYALPLRHLPQPLESNRLAIALADAACEGNDHTHVSTEGEHVESPMREVVQLPLVEKHSSLQKSVIVEKCWV
jgi:hypothetical protein